MRSTHASRRMAPHKRSCMRMPSSIVENPTPDCGPHASVRTPPSRYEAVIYATTSSMRIKPGGHPPSGASEVGSWHDGVINGQHDIYGIMREATSIQSSSCPPPTAGPRAQALRRSIRATGVSSMRTEAGEHDPFGASASWPRNGRCHQWTARHLWNLCGRHVIYANGPRTPFPTGHLNQSCRRPDNR